MNDFKAEPIELQDAIVRATVRVIESGWYVLGEEVAGFEKQWSHTCGVKNGIGVGNGMDAIEIALRSLEIGPGDEVITTPMTAFATVLAIYRAGAIPVLADIDPETALLTMESTARCISKRTKAVLLVHLYGQIRYMAKWCEFCESRGILLIEDCAQAHLASLNGNIAGSFGRAGAYSFYPTKNLGALGDAGMLVTNDNKLAERAGQLRNYGQGVRYQHPELGLNSRLDEIQAAILTERLKWLPAFTQRRQEIALAYRSGIHNSAVQLMSEPEEVDSHVYHLFVINCTQREALQKYLNENGIQTLIHYPVPVHKQKPCLSIQRDPNGLQSSENHAASCLSLPCHPQMTDQDVRIVIDTVNTFEMS